MLSKIAIRPAVCNSTRDTLASRRSAPPSTASSSQSILAGHHQLHVAARHRVQGELLASGFVPRSLRATTYPLPADAVGSPALVAWARQIVHLADAVEQSRYIDSLVGSPSETWEVQS